MAVRVRILLDIDGVLNAVTHEPDPEQWSDWCTTRVDGHRITYSPTVGRFFRRMAETDGVDLLWLTTWGHSANEDLARLLDIPVCEVAGIPPFREKYGWWKFVVAKALWESDQVPFVWIDDDLGGDDDGAAEWVTSLRPYSIGVRPHWSKGLTQGELDEIETFVALRATTCPVHYTSLPCPEVCPAHLLHDPCPTCSAYIAAGL